MKFIYIKNLQRRFTVSLLALFLALFSSWSISLALNSGLGSSSSTDVPEKEGGSGYEVDDNCGFMQDIAIAYKGYRVNFKDQDNDEQACLDAFSGALTGTFYDSFDFDSYVTFVAESGEDIVVDFAPQSISPEQRVQVDLTTGQWSGYGKILSPSVPFNQSFVWFDWTCQDTPNCDPSMLGNESDYWVNTDMNTGATTGFAWSDYLAEIRGDGDGFIAFDTTTLELPPQIIVPYVEIEANDTNLTPGAVDRSSAPQANGIDYWRVGIYFVDMVTGRSLEERDISSLTMSLNLDDNVFIDQVKNRQNAVDVSAWYPKECENTAGDYCILTKSDGTVTFNTFIRSYGPTSNMLWMDESVNGALQEMPTDRDGCLWIYLDQITNTGSTPPKACKTDTSFTSENLVDPDVKWDYFYQRSQDRNYIFLNSITFYIDLEQSGGQSGASYALQSDDSFKSLGGNTYLYTPGQMELSFSPRFIVDGLYTEYDGDTWTSISEDIEQSDMYLNVSAYSLEPSQMVKKFLGTAIDPELNIVYQLDAGTNFEREAYPGDIYLLMDPVGDIADPADNFTYYEEVADFTADGIYSEQYAIGYGQRDDECAARLAPCDEPVLSEVDYISDPTAEMWVCDNVVTQVLQKRGGSGEACYFVAYLPVLDRHADPGATLFEGSTSDFIGQSLADSDTIYKGGAQETLKIRNNFYELGTRYTLGLSTESEATLDLNGSSSFDGGETLMGGRLYYVNGDAYIEEARNFSSATLYVLGGDVYINGNIGNTDSRLGIVALSEDGVGGNVYIDPDVTDLYVNIFADGKLMNQSNNYDNDKYPLWLNEADRLSALKNQLYINGSVSARTPLNQDDVYNELGYYSCDGRELSKEQAKECSIETLRQFRLCYAADPVTGGLGTDLELCNEGESLSEYGAEYAASDPSPVSASYYPSVILEYTAPGNLPIFAAEGIFN